MIERLWLVILLAGLALWTVRGNRQYAEFKRLADSRQRSTSYLRWTGESFILLGGASAITLLLLGRPGALVAMPDAFAPLAASLPDRAPSASGDYMIGFVIGAGIGLAAIAAVQLFRLRRFVDGIAGDIEPLLPRTTRERLSVVPLCLNAGFSEELFFRLALPLLATEVTGSATVGFALALAAFGLMHAYQGWKGVAATSVMGALFTLHYLAHGSLLWLMIAHALIDLIGLLVRPWIASRIAERRRPIAV